MFAGIPAEELAAIPDSIADAIKEPVFMQVSEELGLDYELVRSVGEAVLSGMRPGNGCSVGKGRLHGRRWMRNCFQRSGRP